MNSDMEDLHWLEASIRAENAPEVEAWRKEKARVKALHAAARKGNLNL